MKQKQGEIYLLLAFTLAGTSVVSARFAAGLGAFTITAVSLLLGLGVLVPVYGKRLGQAIRQMGWSEWGMVALQACFGIFLFRALLLTGLDYTSAGEAGLLTGTAPAITALLAWVLLRESLNAKIAVGIGSTVGGILLIQGEPGVGNPLAASHLAGNLLVLGAAASESLFNIFSRAASREGKKPKADVDPVAQTTLVTAAAFMFSLVPALGERPFAALSSLDLTGWLALLWYGWIVTALAFICWYAGIRRSSAFTAAAYSGMMPLTSMVLALVLLGERIDLWQAAGGGMVICGMMLIGLPKRSRNKNMQVQ